MTAIDTVNLRRTFQVPDEQTDAWVAECPGCKTIAPYLGSTGCLEDWDGETYRFKCCGHRAHLSHAHGGARTGVLR